MFLLRIEVDGRERPALPWGSSMVAAGVVTEQWDGCKLTKTRQDSKPRDSKPRDSKTPRQQNPETANLETANLETAKPRASKPRAQQAVIMQLPLPEYVCLLGKSSLISASAVSQTLSSGGAVLESVRSGSQGRWGGVGSGGQAMEKHHCISKLKKGQQKRDFYLALTHCSQMRLNLQPFLG